MARKCGEKSGPSTAVYGIDCRNIVGAAFSRIFLPVRLLLSARLNARAGVV